jgi:hypothetical protein
MTFAFESVREEYWASGEKLLFGKPADHRIMVWVNYDLISSRKIFYCVEKGKRLTIQDFPIPVFWNEETPIASLRLETLHNAIDSSKFAEFPFYSIEETYEDDFYQEYQEADENSEEESYEESFIEENPEEEFYTEETPEEEDEKQEDTKEYLNRQFENFLQDVDEFYHGPVRETFQKQIDNMVKSLKSQVKMNS